MIAPTQLQRVNPSSGYSTYISDYIGGTAAIPRFGKRASTTEPTALNESADNALVYTPLPLSTVIKSVRISYPSPINGTINYKYGVGIGSSIVSKSSLITMPPNQTVISADVNFTVPALDTTNDTTVVNTTSFIMSWTNSVFGSQSHEYHIIDYRVVSDPRVIWYRSGLDLVSPSGTTKFTPVGLITPNATISPFSIWWPVSGTFKYIAFTATIGGIPFITKSVNATLFISNTANTLGNATAHNYTVSDSSPYLVNNNIEVHIQAGQFVQWRMSLNNGGDTSAEGSSVVTIGFIPD